MLEFYIATYSRHNSINKVQKALEFAPDQRPNSPGAFYGSVFEVHPGNHCSVGTLSEVYDVFEVSEIVLHVSDGVCHLIRNEDEFWRMEGSEELSPISAQNL